MNKLANRIKKIAKAIMAMESGAFPTETTVDIGISEEDVMFDHGRPGWLDESIREDIEVELNKKYGSVPVSFDYDTEPVSTKGSLEEDGYVVRTYRVKNIIWDEVLEEDEEHTCQICDTIDPDKVKPYGEWVEEYDDLMELDRIEYDAVLKANDSEEPLCKKCAYEIMRSALREVDG